jgi:hypothetical protein
LPIVDLLIVDCLQGANDQSAISTRNLKGHRHVLAMPCGLAGDPAPQQLTAPCRKYSGRLHPSIEQVVYRSISLRFITVTGRLDGARSTKMVVGLHF